MYDIYHTKFQGRNPSRHGSVKKIDVMTELPIQWTILARINLVEGQKAITGATLKVLIFAVAYNIP